MKKMLTVCMLICLCPVSIAQHAIIMKYHVSHLKMRPCYPTDSVRVDKSYMTVSYRYAQLAPDADTLEWTIIRMAIGKHKISQQDMYLYYDRVRAFAAHEQQPGLSVLRDRFGSGPSNLFVDLMYDKNGKDMQVACGDYLDVDAGKKYVQSLPELQWEIGHKKDTIEGYVCYKARTSYGGRLWNVWYCPDIPSQAGPWKLNGLPGLILKATDDAGHHFDILEVRNMKVPIYRYVFHLQDLKTLDKFLCYERHVYEHPYEIWGKGEDILILTQDKDGKILTRSKDWQIPYNPIERE